MLKLEKLKSYPFMATMCCVINHANAVGKNTDDISNLYKKFRYYFWHNHMDKFEGWASSLSTWFWQKRWGDKILSFCPKKDHLTKSQAVLCYSQEVYWVAPFFIEAIHLLLLVFFLVVKIFCLKYWFIYLCIHT